MKKIFVVLFLLLMAFAIPGCSGSSLDEKDLKPHKIVVAITRSSGFAIDPTLYIAAESANIQADFVVIEGIVSVTGTYTGFWVSPQMEIRDNKLFISIPKDNPYKINITPVSK